MCDSGRHREQAIDQPQLASHERGMRRARQPLGEADDVFDPSLLCGNRKGDRALDHVGIERRTKIGTLDVLQRVGHALDIAHVCHRDLGPECPEPRGAAIFPVHQGADGIACLQQFSNDDATGFPGRASNDDSWFGHDCPLDFLTVPGPCGGTSGYHHDLDARDEERLRLEQKLVRKPQSLEKLTNRKDVVLYSTIVVKERVMAAASRSKRRQEGGDETAVRERILDAAFAAFMKSGYAAASTLEIATCARVSKRELYALVGNKQEMLIACISERAKRFDVPADLPVLRDRETLAQVLASFGTKVVREASDPTVIAVFRLAISEVIQSPEVARALDSIARERSRAALRKIMAEAQASGLLTGRPAELARQFAGLLWCDLQVSLLLGVAERPNPREVARRARDAAAAFLQLHRLPK